MIVEHGTLVVAADAGGAVIYRNAGQQGEVKLDVLETHNAKNGSFTRADGGDKPDSYSDAAGGKSAVAGHDYHEQGEQKFATRLAKHVDGLIGAPTHGEHQTGVVICASPRFLGMIRGEYSARVKSALKAEIAKDLREAPAKQIEQALAGLEQG